MNTAVRMGRGSEEEWDLGIGLQAHTENVYNKKSISIRLETKRVQRIDKARCIISIQISNV